MRTPIPLTPGAEKDRFVVMPPAPQKCIADAAACDGEISPGQVGGTWYPRLPTKGEDLGIVVLHFHGGAYVHGDGRIEHLGFTAKTILGNTDATFMLAPQYRLATYKNSRFPAQLQDAVSSYLYLQHELGVPASRIVVSGDSAGGHLVMCLLRYISESGAKTGLAHPGCAWLWAPWFSPYNAIFDSGRRFTSNPNYSVDYVPLSFGQWGANAFAPAPSTGLTLSSPMLHYPGNPFPTKTPVWIQFGEKEVLLRDGVRAAEDMRRTEGNTVELEITETAVHDILLVGPVLGFVAEAVQAAGAAGAFLRRHVEA